MEEKVIVQSKRKFNNIIAAIITLVSSIIIGFGSLVICSQAVNSGYVWDYDFLLRDLLELFFVWVPIVVIGLIQSIVFLGYRYKLIVTDKRVYGNGFFGKRIDLPVDSISAVETSTFMFGIVVATSSGKIKFRWIKNYKEIHRAISDLLIERQRGKENTTDVVVAPNIDTADQLKKYKDLLDGGVITQAEFDAKKKQLLGL